MQFVCKNTKEYGLTIKVLRFFIIFAQNKKESMKILQSHLFRAICAIIIGALLIKYREDMVQWLTIAIGILFFLSGVISLIVYYAASRQRSDTIVYDAHGKQISGMKPSFPIVGLGSLILGLVLAFMPHSFISGLMYILAAILILGAINQFFNLASALKFSRIGFFYWLMPSLILLTGIYICIKPMDSASLPLLVIGWGMLVYGVVECINAFKIHTCHKMWEEQNKMEHDAIEIKDTDN